MPLPYTHQAANLQWRASRTAAPKTRYWVPHTCIGLMWCGIQSRRRGRGSPTCTFDGFRGLPRHLRQDTFIIIIIIIIIIILLLLLLLIIIIIIIIIIILLLIIIITTTIADGALLAGYPEGHPDGRDRGIHSRAARHAPHALPQRR
jgi:hypothetical protein